VLLVGLLVRATAAGTTAYRIDTWAGGGTLAQGVGDGLPATMAVLAAPTGLARDRRGAVYVTDHDHARVRRIVQRRGATTIETVAGRGERATDGDGGPATEAALIQPTGVATMGRQLLVAEAGDEHHGGGVRRIDRHGIIRAFIGHAALPPANAGDGLPAREAGLYTPLRVAVGRRGDVYVVELNNHQVRVVRRRTGLVERVAGTGTPGDDGDGGPAVLAHLRNPAGLALGRHHELYVADFGNQRVRVVLPDGTIQALAGTGVATHALDGEGGDPRDDLGDGGPASAASFDKPTGLAVDRDGALLVADQGNNRIRRIAPDARGRLGPASVVDTIAGTGEPGFSGDGGDARVATLRIPTEVLPLRGGRLLIADRGNDRLRLVVPVR
jgi:glucose/arabinose dehydrogenase